ncbi:MAG: hemolysin D, partial [Planctomycetota bacterium]
MNRHSHPDPLMTAVEDRPIPLRKRTDLQIQESLFQDEKSWIVKDPIGLRYHRLRKAEISVLNMLDGQHTLRDIKEHLQDLFPTKLVRLGDLQGLLASLHRAGMVIADTAGQANQLLTRKRESNRRQWMGRLSNVLAIRLPGFDPEWILKRIDPWFGWIFSKPAFLGWAILALAALTLVGANWTEFQLKMPQFYSFFGPRNFCWLALVMIGTKVCHEFGHGLACKRFGGECHEIGVLLLVFTPAMYCDTSDSWLLPNKWHRAAIGAAGMYVEVFIASIATFLWWYSKPGLFHYLCLNVMFVSSVSTVIFNANPLLRYDGYYILSDIMEIPNLAQKSRLALMNFLRVTCLGMKPVSPRQLPERNQLLFACYSIASFCYRWVVLFVIVYFLVKI